MDDPYGRTGDGTNSVSYQYFLSYLGLIGYLIKTYLTLVLIGFNWVNTHLTKLIVG